MKYIKQFLAELKQSKDKLLSKASFANEHNMKLETVSLMNQHTLLSDTYLGLDQAIDNDNNLLKTISDDLQSCLDILTEIEIPESLKETVGNLIMNSVSHLIDAKHE